jgi:DNA-binding XRE family transcriptional regulator
LKGGEKMEEKSKKRIKMKQWRVGLDMSQEQMADSLNVSRSQYAAIENGQRYGTLKFWNKLQIKHNVPKDKVFEMMTEIEF